MPTKSEIKQIERVFKKPISKVEEIDIPSYIKQRKEKEFNSEMNLINELERRAEEIGQEN